MTPTEALAPLIAIADAYDASNLDEVRPEWDVSNPGAVELFAGRGGKRLLTLQDCFNAREAAKLVEPFGWTWRLNPDDRWQFVFGVEQPDLSFTSGAKARCEWKPVYD